MTSSVIFVSRLQRSVEYYRDVFSCEVAIHDGDAALLLAPGGFQIYLIGRGARTPHPSAGIGLQFLIWTVRTAAELEEVEAAIEECGGRTDSYVSGGVTFVASRDPDGIRVLVAHPSPETLPRSVVGARLYN
ncbi:VOC family protein [Nocardioides guangzhouensis]|uniref:VOC family protein n=1 Tax=Nocardioides guangzhouensis TaxID=2497878 RepID=A0A4Q4ZBH2_9ACTN|nr:VOC family protein [Nocardioides guangzhouensis]RYP84484.1 VOC family protein [Nocardioides guangzhouensis]